MKVSIMAQLVTSSLRLLTLLACFLGWNSQAAELVIAFSLDDPPHVMDGAKAGIEIEIVRAALKETGYTFTTRQLPYGQLADAVVKGNVDAAATVISRDDGTFYSDNYITFHNVAITKKSSGIELKAVAELKGRSILAWENAWEALGPEFQVLFSPKVKEPYRKKYMEIADQKEQVEKFWSGKAEVIVIDESIMRWFSNELRHEVVQSQALEYHRIFSPNTEYRVSFKSEKVRNDFNEGLREIRSNGVYEGLYDKYLSTDWEDRKSVAEANARFYAALNQLFIGKSGAMEDVWSHADDVTYMGPSGGLKEGWDQVGAYWKRQAAKRLGGDVKPDKMRLHIGREIAITWCNEVGENIIDGKPQAVSIRATNIFGREKSQWKMIGHHTDLLPYLGSNGNADQSAARKSMDDDVRAVEMANNRFYVALNAMFQGNAKPIGNVWWQTDEAVLMGADGSYSVGWQETYAFWRKMASLRIGGEVKPEQTRVALGPDIAVVSNNVRGVHDVDGKQEAVNVRATSVFRKREGVWKMIGHHVDVRPSLRKSLVEDN
jgi:polar amino acid transport system substrate-binding protein